VRLFHLVSSCSCASRTEDTVCKAKTVRYDWSGVPRYFTKRSIWPFNFSRISAFAVKYHARLHNAINCPEIGNQSDASSDSVDVSCGRLILAAHVITHALFGSLSRFAMHLAGGRTMGIVGGARAMRLPAALAVPRYNQGYRTLKEYLE
jgi:hypothetical protein